jgi:hypothetical protein
MFSKFLFIFFNQETFIEKLILEHEFHYEFLSYYSLEHFFFLFFQHFYYFSHDGNLNKNNIMNDICRFFKFSKFSNWICFKGNPPHK